MSRLEASRCLVLLMRKQLRFRSADHIQALLDLAVDIHLVTVEQEDVLEDPRFASCLRLPADLPEADIVTVVVDVAKKTGASAVITFAEVDIVIAGAANEQLGVPWANNAADRICRDKALQREFLRAHEIASVWHHSVSDIGSAIAVASDRGLPLIVKPTRAASSSHVELVTDIDRLAAALADIERFAQSRSRSYYDQMPEHWAIIEEYLPGREVTLDAVVLDGEFILGGICDKFVSAGPFFEEDLYTFPFSTPEREPELARVTTCNKVIFGTGTVVRNSAGDTCHSPHFRAYYPMAKPGERVAAAPAGFDTVGTLSVRMPWHHDQSPARIHAVAYELAAQLDVKIRPDQLS